MRRERLRRRGACRSGGGRLALQANDDPRLKNKPARSSLVDEWAGLFWWCAQPRGACYSKRGRIDRLDLSGGFHAIALRKFCCTAMLLNCHGHGRAGLAPWAGVAFSQLPPAVVLDPTVKLAEPPPAFRTSTRVLAGAPPRTNEKAKPVDVKLLNADGWSSQESWGGQTRMYYEHEA